MEKREGAFYRKKIKKQNSKEDDSKERKTKLLFQLLKSDYEPHKKLTSKIWFISLVPTMGLDNFS